LKISLFGVLVFYAVPVMVIWTVKLVMSTMLGETERVMVAAVDVPGDRVVVVGCHVIVR
jgi:hypothetical protein